MIVIEWWKEEHIFTIELGEDFKLHLSSGTGGDIIEAGLPEIEKLHTLLGVALREADEEREIPDFETKTLHPDFDTELLLKTLFPTQED